MATKLNMVAAFRKTKLIYEFGNHIYHLDINEIADDSSHSIRGFKTINSTTRKFKKLGKGVKS